MGEVGGEEREKGMEEGESIWRGEKDKGRD